MLLENVKGIHPDTELEDEYTALTEQMNILFEQMNVLLEDPMEGQRNRMPAPGQVSAGDDDIDSLITAMEQVSKQMKAAKKGLGLVNKLGDGPSRTTNRSRVMGNMNRIRANLRRIEKQFAAFMDANEDRRTEMGYDIPAGQ